MSEEGQPGASSSILLVDDNEANLIAMSALIEGLGHPVLTASSGMEAIECLGRHEVALILMDVQMPGLDGFQTLAKIRAEKQWSHIPAVFLTAIHDDPEHEARGYALGAVDYVAKPFRSDVLVAKLRALVSWHDQGEQLRREAEELARERATRAERERILGIVSHDMRSPLATIRTGADYLLASGLAEDQGKIARRIQRNADRMARLISDLLDFTRLQGGPLRIRPKPASLAEIVKESVEDLQQTSPRPIQLSVETQRTGSVDGDRLAQAISNLVINAVQHSEESAQVAVVLREHDDAFELSVWNEGEMRTQDQTSVFEPFQRGESSGGMGLGLYITQQIARAHGGDITVSSSPGTGTTFRLTLPVIR